VIATRGCLETLSGLIVQRQPRQLVVADDLGLRPSVAGTALMPALALAVGGCIASYTLVDKDGIVHSAPITSLELVFAATAAGYLIPTWRPLGARALQAAITWPTLVAGAGFFASYAVTLAALSLAPATSVAAVRETSVVIAAAVLAVSGRERLRIGRIIGSVAVVGGT
jgi:drug/metabolite transporter (DMT)-like permease